MWKIGEFSKLSHLTVKALRYYEKEGILLPAHTDTWTGYRFYDTAQLIDAARVKALRQLDVPIEEIKAICSGADETEILTRRAAELEKQADHIQALLSAIHTILEEGNMNYTATEKIVPKALVYYSETVLDNYGELMTWIPAQGRECLRLNPDMRCAEPPYEFCEYPDGEYKERDFRIRHNEAVLSRGVENDIIRFREIPETKVLSVFHKGSYDDIGAAYAFIMNYAEKNGYAVTGLARECYIDGIWNKENPADWLTEIQLPID